jgi:hypothetical protein
MEGAMSMRKRFGQRREIEVTGEAGPRLAPVSSGTPRGGNLVIEIAQWLVTTVTLGQAVWRWLSRPRGSSPKPPEAPGQDDRA